MQDKLKYVIDDYGNIAIFSPTAVHSDIARQMYGKAVSAGFVDFEVPADGVLDVKCFGESVSLGVKSNGFKDEEIIREKLLGY